jgi:hypothetical protein
MPAFVAAKGTILCYFLVAAVTSAAGDVDALNISSWAGKRVLFITAHPDDIEGFSGGLVAALQRQGNVEVSYLISTNGDKGGLVSCCSLDRT